MPQQEVDAAAPVKVVKQQGTNTLANPKLKKVHQTGNPDEDVFQTRKMHNQKKADELIAKALELRKKRKAQKDRTGYKQRLFVVSNTLGRSDTGPDALHALREATK